jgi:hypothetical protein
MNGESEAAADTGFAFKRNGAAHQLNETLRNGQAESGATEFAGGGHVGLSKSFENGGAFLRLDADAGVRNNEFEGGARGIGAQEA